MGDPDDYESSDATADGTEFPTDTSATGKHYQMAVPDYIPGTQDMSYFRHGVPHSLASTWTGAAWTQSGSATALGDNLLQQVVAPSGFVSTLGGARDHTDGNRIVTTRQDSLEVIGGQYQQLILGNQPSTGDPDPDWQTPNEQTNGEEPSSVTHEYSSWYYEVISTMTQPASGSYAESRTNVATAKSNGWDYYEYENANNYIEIMAAQTTMAEKMYAGSSMIEVMSTVHASHPDWEGDISGLSDGDLKEYMLGKNITEVMKAEWDINERIESTQGGISELMLAAGGINEVTTAGGAVHEMTTAGGAISEETIAGGLIHELTAAGGLILEETLAGGLINELTAAIGAIFEETVAGGMISETTLSPGDITETVTAGGVLTDIMVGGSLFFDAMGAVGLFFEIMAAATIMEVYAAPVIIDVTLGTKTEYEIVNNKLTDVTNKLENEVNKLSLEVTRLEAETVHLGEEYECIFIEESHV
jgi:hypothetical protein